MSKEDKLYPLDGTGTCLEPGCLKRLEAESKRHGVRHKIVLMDGSEIERKLTLIEAGVLRRLFLACHVTGQLFDPNDGRCLSSTRIFARSA
jgi:hypothetical protein